MRMAAWWIVKLNYDDAKRIMCPTYDALGLNWYTGRQVGAEEAEKFGLVSKLFRQPGSSLGR